MVSQPEHIEPLEVVFGPHRLTFPRRWEDVTLRQFLALRGDNNTVGDTLEILASDKGLVDLIQDPNADAEILSYLGFLKKKLDIELLPKPKVVQVAGKTVKVPQDLGLETFGQKREVDALFSTMNDSSDFVPVTAEFLAIYFAPQLTGKPFSRLDDRAEHIESVLNMPCMDALGVGAFFLRKWSQTNPTGKVTYKVRQSETLSMIWLKKWLMKLRLIRSTN